MMIEKDNCLRLQCHFCVFQKDDRPQNGVKLLTPVYDLVFNALSDGTKHFALYGS